MISDPDLLECVDRISSQYEALHNEMEHIWMRKMVFSWHWWLIVALSVLPWILWLIVRDRKNTHNLLYAGLFIMLPATFLCILGVSQGWWMYNSWVFPDLSQYFPWDLSVMPVTAMIFYQFYPRVKPWIKGTIFAVAGAYVVEPIFIWLGIYKPTGWKLHYGLPIYFAIYMIGYWLYTRKRLAAP